MQSTNATLNVELQKMKDLYRNLEEANYRQVEHLHRSDQVNFVLKKSYPLLEYTRYSNLFGKAYVWFMVE